MAGKKLTPLSKILIVAVIIGGVYFLLNKLRDPKVKDKINEVTASSETKEGYQDVLNIGVVTWGGYAGGQYFNEGFKANTNSRFYKDYGFKVNFKVIDDFDASRDAFKNGDIDLMWATIDAFPTEVAGLSQYQPQVVFQADWSRGGDAIVARRGINKVSDLRGKKIAVAPMTPSHSFLIWLLEAGDISVKDVKIIEVPSAIDAADAFKSGTVDAAVVWSPDDADCVQKVAGARVLESTKNATHIIADVFVAKKDFIENNKEQLRELYEGWMIGASELNNSDANKKKAAKILAEGLSQPEDFCYDAINNVRLATHGDNQNFFGLNSNYNGVTGENLYNKMKVKYQNLGYNTSGAKSWRLLSTKDLVTKTTSLTGANHVSEKEKQFSKANDKLAKKASLSSKKVSISFRTGQFILSDNSKQLIDVQFTPIAKAFANTRIRIEGNTDNVGKRSSNVLLSRRRAQSVANYLIDQHNMPKNRFIILGNGPDKPIAGCERNQNKSCQAQNRRTDFELVVD
ncbi:phosphate ABC transporter substrate-binding/OmpA family protein [Tenacibaculum finnmarkense]|uniref:phosphate ABC transporter substrate-binding/OmpA family protein n=1 Tax=Tenacibaculum finnmarkense TaxID=2781243 RepID=UPI001E525607|nr:phosphate ABC transporter substrate-binding/OmpA family protein [Tenacibaculum finnmarkense]MCD8401574.1 phosphate ABC transporter substrate-binding/OmpA family protein [Tenacibaculum finnmarkense genomovar finnmarkense]